MDQGQTLQTLKKQAQTALKGKDWPRGAEVLSQWCELKPGDSKGWYYRAFFAMKLGRLNDAHSYGQKSLSLTPDNQEAEKLLAMVKQRLSREETKADISTATVWQKGAVVDGRYEVRGSKKGGMGAVYFAYDRRLNHMVAIKAPLQTIVHNETQKSRFYREAEAWVGLGMHPNICTAYYVQDLGNTPWLFMEYVDGGTLEDWLKNKDLSFGERLDIAIQIASGMSHTHTLVWRDDHGKKHRGLVHRDIKPANILMDRDGSAKVTDFGLVGLTTDQMAVVSAEDTLSTEATETKSPDPSREDIEAREVDDADVHWKTITMEGGALGTPPYMAPEQWRSAHVVGPTADIYAFGCTLYEIFCGRRPFLLDDKFRHAMPAHKAFQWESMHKKQEPPDPRSLKPGLNDHLAELMLLCLRKDPQERPESFELIRQTLASIYHDTEGQAYPRAKPRAYRLLADSLNNQGVSYVNIRQSRRAEAAWREALKTDPHHLEATFNLAMYEWKNLGIPYEDVRRRLEEVGQSYTPVWRYKLLMGRMFLFFGEYRKAVNHLQDSLREGEAGLLGYRDLGLALCALAGSHHEPGLWKEAESCFAKVMEMGYEDPAVITGYALVLRNLDRTNAAYRFFIKASRRHPDMSASLDEAIPLFLPGQEIIDTVPHVGWVHSLSFSLDGHQAWCGSENKMGIWNILTAGDQPTTMLNLTVDHLPDQPARPPVTLEKLESVGARLRRSDLRPARSLKDISIQGGPLTAVSLSRDGGQALAGSEDGTVRLWKLPGGELAGQYKIHGAAVSALAFSSDARYAVSAAVDSTLVLWETANGDILENFQGHLAAASALTFSPNNRFILVGSRDGAALYWDSFSGHGVKSLEGHTEKINQAAISPDGKYALTAGDDKTIRLWGLEVSKCLRVFQGHGLKITSLAFSPDGRYFLSGSDDRTLRLWNVRTMRLERIFHFNDRIEALAISTDGSLVLLAQANAKSPGDKILCLMDFPSPEKYQVPYVVTVPVSASLADERENLFRAGTEEIRRLLVAGDYENALLRIQETRSIPGYERDPEAIELWEQAGARFPRQRLRSAWELEVLEGHSSAVSAVAFLPDHKHLVSAGQDKTIRHWETEGGKCLARLEGHTSQVNALAVYGRGRYVLSGGSDYALRLWDLEDRSCLRALIEHTGEIMDVAVSPDSRFAVSGSRDETVKLWDLMSNVCIRTLTGHSAAVNAVDFSPDGRHVVSGGSDKTVRLWDIETSACLRVMLGHGQPVTAVAFSPDGRHVVSSSEDGTLFRWEAYTDAYPEVFKGHTGPINAVCVSPDSRFAVSGSDDLTMRLWDFRTGKCLRIFESHSKPILGVAFSLDGRLVVSGGADRTVRTWYLDWETDFRPDILWDEGARPYVDKFLYLHTPYLRGKLGRAGLPAWEETDFDEFLKELTVRGYGWLSPRGVENAIRESAGKRKSLKEILLSYRDMIAGLKLKSVLTWLLRKLVSLVIRLVPATIWVLLLLNLDMLGLSKPLAVVTTLFFLFIMFVKRK